MRLAPPSLQFMVVALCACAGCENGLPGPEGSAGQLPTDAGSSEGPASNEASTAPTSDASTPALDAMLESQSPDACGGEFQFQGCRDAGAPEAAVASEAGLDGDLTDPNSCAWNWNLAGLASCPFVAAQITGDGMGPEGAIALANAHVVYHAGFVSGTSVAFVGTAGGRPFAIDMLILEAEGGSPVMPGSYVPANASLYWVGADGTCAELRSAPVSLTVDAHEVPDGSSLDAGAPVRLEGELEIDTESWQAHIEFAIDRSCGSNFHI